MSYVVFGRAIKNEHLALGVLGTAFGGAWLASRGGSSKTERPAAGTPVKQAVEAVPINAGSKEEEEFIKNFLVEAEKEGSSNSKH